MQHTSPAALMSGVEVLDKLLGMGGQRLKASDADRQTPRSPGIGQRNDPNCHRSSAPICRRCRDDGQSDPALHDPADRVKTRKTDTQLQAPAGTRRMILYLVLERVAADEAHIVVIQGIAKGDLPLPRQHVITRRNHNQPVFREGMDFEFLGGVHLIANDPDVGEIPRDGSHDLPTGTLLQIDVDIGAGRQECPQDGRQEFGRRRRIRQQAHTTSQALGMLRQFPSHPLQLLNDDLGVMDERRSCGRGADPATVPFKERSPEGRLHRANTLTCRRQCHPCPLGAMRDARRFGDMKEQA
jgi:hypothetical protein